ncbi:MAG: EVE domain-containing protein [Ignavibacteriales bacterium]|nr:EVE domain-containing protein [Ignavibacteriales bacterium]
MKYWVVKFAPFRYSWSDILLNGKFEIYSVRNIQACNNLKQMKVDDKVLFYHSQIEKQIMGIMKVIEEAHKDKTTANNRWVSVTYEPIESFNKPVSLNEIKNTNELADIGLIRQPRLSVMPIKKEYFDIIVKKGTKII